MKLDIKKVQEITGMNLKVLSERMGVHYQTIINLKTKKASKQLCYAYKLSKLTGVPINELLKEDE